MKYTVPGLSFIACLYGLFAAIQFLEKDWFGIPTIIMLAIGLALLAARMLDVWLD
jgi:hypothetical protein